MNNCTNCGNPISKVETGALHTSPNHCPRCNALISSVSSKPSQQTSHQPQLGSQGRTEPPSSSTTTNRQGTGPIPAGALTEHDQGKDRDIATTDMTESKAQMNTDSHTQQPALSDDDPLPSAEEREEARRLSLSRQGFVLDEDVHGLRLSGVTSRPGGLSSQLSPYDVVRLAAELEGGVVPMEQRKRCPKCEAVVSPGDKQCQWCSEPLET